MTGRTETMNHRKSKAFRFAKFSRRQRMVLSWWQAPEYMERDGIICDGAIRSGKTVCLSLSFVLWAMADFDGENFAMSGKTIGSLRRNVLPVLKLMLAGRGYGVADHRADNLITVSRGGKENYFYLFGGKDERSQDLVQGITLAGALFDEVALMPQSFVNQATARCSVEGSKWWFNDNPAGPRHWFKTDWIDKRKDKNLIYLHFTMDDNLSLSERIKARYRAMYSGVFYKRYILGVWCVAEGIIYDMFDPKRHVFDGRRDGMKTYISCDYGTQNATVFLLWKRDGSRSYCVSEYYYSGRDQEKQKTDSQYADDLDAWLLENNTSRDDVDAFVVDPSAASFIAELRKRGWKIRKARNDVVDGIRLVGTLLNEDRLSFSAACTNTLTEFSSYVWDEKAMERGEDKPVKQFDHAMDAVRYYASTILAGSGAHIKTFRGGM